MPLVRKLHRLGISGQFRHAIGPPRELHRVASARLGGRGRLRSIPPCREAIRYGLLAVPFANLFRDEYLCLIAHFRLAQNEHMRQISAHTAILSISYIGGHLPPSWFVDIQRL